MELLTWSLHLYKWIFYINRLNIIIFMNVLVFSVFFFFFVGIQCSRNSPHFLFFCFFIRKHLLIIICIMFITIIVPKNIIIIIWFVLILWNFFSSINFHKIHRLFRNAKIYIETLHHYVDFTFLFFCKSILFSKYCWFIVNGKTKNH